jgi:hypothetical protein
MGPNSGYEEEIRFGPTQLEEKGPKKNIDEL